MKIRVNRRQFIGFSSAILGSLALKACGNSNSPSTSEETTTETPKSLNIN